MLELDLITFQSLNMAIAAGISIFVILLMIGKLLFTSPLLDTRLEKLRSYYTIMDPLSLKSSINNQIFQRKKKEEKNKKKLPKTIKNYILKNPFLADDTTKIAFEQAGWTSKETQFLFIISKIICFFMGLIVGYLVISRRTSFDQASFIVKWLILILIGFSSWLIPDLYLRGMIKNRIELIEKQFPDALDLITICLQAGLGFNRSTERVAKEIVLFGKEIAHELAVTHVELELMLDRRQALKNLYARVPSPIIRIFTTTVLQSIQQGTPTLEALDILSKEIRNNRMQRAEEKAAKLPSLLVIPLVLFVMPNLFIVLLGPAIVRLLSVT